MLGLKKNTILFINIFFFIFISYFNSSANEYRIKTSPHKLNFREIKFTKIENINFKGAENAILSGTLFEPVNAEKCILILHGLGARKINYYPIALELARSNFAVFVYSFRSHGDSTGNYDLNLMVDDVISALKLLKSRKNWSISILGGSTGGMVGFKAAETCKLIEKMVIIAAPVSFNDIVRRDRLYGNLARFQKPKFLMPDVLTDFLMKVFIDSITRFENDSRSGKELDKRLIFTFNLNKRGIFATNYGDLNIHSGTDFIRKSLKGPSMDGKKITIPHLVITGMGDDITGTETEKGLRRYKSNFPHAEFMIIKADHRKKSYLTTEVKKKVINFLKK